MHILNSILKNICKLLFVFVHVQFEIKKKCYWIFHSWEQLLNQLLIHFQEPLPLPHATQSRCKMMYRFSFKWNALVLPNIYSVNLLLNFEYRNSESFSKKCSTHLNRNTMFQHWDTKSMCHLSWVINRLLKCTTAHAMSVLVANPSWQHQ